MDQRIPVALSIFAVVVSLLTFFGVVILNNANRHVWEAQIHLNEGMVNQLDTLTDEINRVNK